MMHKYLQRIIAQANFVQGHWLILKYMIRLTMEQADGIQISLHQQLVRSLLTIILSKLMREQPQGTIAQAYGVQEHLLIL